MGYSNIYMRSRMPGCHCCRRCRLRAESEGCDGDGSIFSSTTNYYWHLGVSGEFGYLVGQVLRVGGGDCVAQRPRCGCLSQEGFNDGVFSYRQRTYCSCGKGLCSRRTGYFTNAFVTHVQCRGTARKVIRAGIQPTLGGATIENGNV